MVSENAESKKKAGSSKKTSNDDSMDSFSFSLLFLVLQQNPFPDIEKIGLFKLLP